MPSPLRSCQFSMRFNAMLGVACAFVKLSLLHLLTAAVVSAMAQQTPNTKQQSLRAELEKVRHDYKTLTQRKYEIDSQPNDAAARRESEESQEILPILAEREHYWASLLRKIEAGRDTTEGVSNICPAHNRKMRVIRVPIAYGLLAIRRSDPSLELRHQEFPFALDYWPGGCVVGPYTEAKIYICPDCQRAEKEWRKAHSK